LYDDLAEKAIVLGYFPKIEKTKDVTISFRQNTRNLKIFSDKIN
jgi:hypothetical protein